MADDADKSLGVLTGHFLTAVCSEGLVQITSVADQLKVSKRRLYDIINVLEPVGLLERVDKNQVRWVGSDDQNSTGMYTEEHALDRAISESRHKLEALVARSGGYMSHKDIMSLPGLRGRTVIGIKAPEGSTVILPPPLPNLVIEESREILLQSLSDPADIYLIGSETLPSTAISNSPKTDTSLSALRSSISVNHQHAFDHFDEVDMTPINATPNDVNALPPIEYSQHTEDESDGFICSPFL